MKEKGPGEVPKGQSSCVEGQEGALPYETLACAALFRHVGIAERFGRRRRTEGVPFPSRPAVGSIFRHRCDGFRRAVGDSAVLMFRGLFQPELLLPRPGDERAEGKDAVIPRPATGQWRPPQERGFCARVPDPYGRLPVGSMRPVSTSEGRIDGSPCRICTGPSALRVRGLHHSKRPATCMIRCG